jgi:RNase P protein component
MREVIRIYVLPYLGSVDVVVQANREAYDASFIQLQTHLIEGIQRATSGLEGK